MIENSSPETPHVLILLYGAGSGMGKSTLARAIAEHLLLRNIRTRFVEEHEVLEIPEFQDYVRQVEQAMAMTQTPWPIAAQPIFDIWKRGFLKLL
jgi:predicted AAA+ superfamily ATPase